MDPRPSDDAPYVVELRAGRRLDPLRRPRAVDEGREGQGVEIQFPVGL